MNFEAAARFIWENARLLDRQRFIHHFVTSNNASIIAALCAYQNADGGFGHALEPDARAPTSQPETTRLALETFEEAGALDHPAVRRAASWLASVARADGSLPFCTPSVLDYPHAPWWNPAQEFAPINPVGFVAGVLTDANVENEWLDRATAFCWDWITRAESFDQYALHNVQRFLAAHRHTMRGTELEAKARRVLASGDVIPIDPAEKRGGDTHTPLHFVPSPSHAWHDVFADHVVERFVDALENAQQPDGGWPIDWEAPGPAALSEWRGRVTLEAMLVLRNYGRI